jgi:hypothetical protein
MDRHDRRRRQGRPHRFAASVEGLEGRELPSLFGTSSNQIAYRASIVRHEYDQYVGELKRLELASQATPAEYLALRDDARAISAAASGANLSVSDAQYRTVAASLILDRSPLYGWVGDAGWAEVSSRLTTTLDGLEVPPSLIDQTVTDMRALAVSAGVSPGGFAAFTDDFNTLRDGEQSLPANSGYHFEDPSLYYTQHLRGFFRGWGVEKVEAQAKLERDLATIRHQAGTGPAGAAVLDRDAQLLERLGAAVPSTTKDQFNATYVAGFAQGAPTPAGLSLLRSNLIAILGPAGTSGRIGSVGRLVADAPEFYAAAGESESNIQTIATDVGTLVDAGGGETLNPFKVTIQPGRATAAAG